MECMDSTGVKVRNKDLSQLTKASDLVSYFQEKLYPGVPEDDSLPRHPIARWFVQHEKELPPNMTFVPYDKKRKHETMTELLKR